MEVYGEIRDLVIKLGGKMKMQTYTFSYNMECFLIFRPKGPMFVAMYRLANAKTHSASSLSWAYNGRSLRLCRTKSLHTDQL